MFKTTKAKVIFVAIFTIICIAITAILIIYQNIDINKDKIQEEQPINKPVEKDVAGIDLKGKYNQNDIKLEEKKFTQEKVEIQYYEISGLKDKTIQDKINREIEQYALNYYKEEIKDLNEVVNVSVSMWNTANFSNALSIDLNYFASKNNDEEEFYQKNIGLNYDLRTGEKITIDKLFTSDAPIEDILRKSAYYSFVEQCEVDEYLSGELKIKDYGEDIEERILDFITLYKRGKIDRFNFSPREIYVYYNDNYVRIDIEEYAKYIAIYNRYLSDEDIYETNQIGYKNLYTLSTRTKDMYYYSNYQNENNYFIDVFVNNYDLERTEFENNVLKEKIDKIEKEVEKVKKIAANNPNNFYILNYGITTYRYKDLEPKIDVFECIETGNTYEITIHDFEENIEPIIMEMNKGTLEGQVIEYIYDFSEQLNIEPQKSVEHYNIETGEKVVI